MVEKSNSESFEPNPNQGQQPATTQSMADVDTHDPLSGANPKSRSYSRSVNPNDIADIPEPNFNQSRGPTDVPDWEREAQGQAGASTGSTPSTGGAGKMADDGDRFSDVRDLPPGQKRKSAKAFAKILVDAYGKYVPLFFQWWAKYPEDKLFELSAKGKVDFGIQFSFPDQTVKNIYQTIQGINNQIEVNFEVSEQWKQEILPYVIEELRNRGWGTTPMQTILWMVGEDLAMKTVSAMMIQNQIRTFLDFAMEETKARRGTGASSSPPPPPAQEEEPPPPPPPTETQPTDMPSSRVADEDEIITPDAEVIPNPPLMEEQ